MEYGSESAPLGGSGLPNAFAERNILAAGFEACRLDEQKSLTANITCSINKIWKKSKKLLDCTKKNDDIPPSVTVIYHKYQIEAAEPKLFRYA